MARVGYIGLGTMGSHMARNILSAGHELHVYDVNKAAVSTLVDAGAVYADSPAALAAAVDQVHLSLPDSPDVLDVAIGNNGLTHGGNDGLIIVDHSTIAPKVSQQLEADLGVKGIRWLDAPVSGGPAGAKAATLTIMVGGSPEAFEAVRPVLSAIGKNLEYMGGSGLGATTKVVNQLVVGIAAMAMCESFSLAAAAGISAKRTHEVLSKSSAACWVLDKIIPAVLLPNRQDEIPAVWFALRLQHKDARIAVDTARELGVPLAAGSLAAQLYAIAEGQGWGKRDQMATIDLYANYIGIENW